MNINYGDILKKAYIITKDNRSLWLFGFILALFGGSSFPNFSGNFGDQTNQINASKMPKIDPSQLTLILVLVAVVVLVIVIISIFLTFLARGALVDMVKDINDKKAVSVKSGFKGGFTFLFPLFAISLLIGVPFVLAIIFIGAILLGPGILLIVAEKIVIGIILLVVGGLVWLAALIAGAIATTLITIYADRYLIINETGIVEAIKQGYYLLKNNVGSSIVLWLITVGIGIAYGIAALIVLLILGLPIFLLAMATTWWLLILLIIPFVILTFARGLVEAYFSTYWTLAFERLNA